MANSWRIGRDGRWETERGLPLSPFSPDRSGKRIRLDYEMQSGYDLSRCYNDSLRQNSCSAREMPPCALRVDLSRNSVNATCESTYLHVDHMGRDQVNQPYCHYQLNEQSSDTATGAGGRTSEVVLPPNACNTLFVDGLPTTCTRREASHIFRPFIGFKDLRLVTRCSKKPGRGLVTLCFVDFTSPEQAAVAMNCLQGYKFDRDDSNSSHLKLRFSHPVA